MRPSGWQILLLSFALAGLQTTTPAHAADSDLVGMRKLVFIEPFTETEILIAELKEREGKLTSLLKDTIALRTPPQMSVVTTKDGVVRFFLKLGDSEFPFVGSLAKNGSIYGTIALPGNPTVPARLDKTKALKVVQPAAEPPPVVQSYFKAKSEKDPHARVKSFQAILDGRPGSPTLAKIYTDLLRDADAAGLGVDEVKRIVTEWTLSAEPYGVAYSTSTKVQVLEALAGKPAYAKTAVDLAIQADAAAAKAGVPIETRAAVVKALATAANDAGDKELQAATAARSGALEHELDVEYHKNVPPFKPLAESRVKDRKSNKVLLLELFTGAQCPPCVAADVGFDGVITTYKPTELIALQYHLHIPGPDPMTNPDSVERSEFYPDLAGTPSAYLDGHSINTNGGPMAGSKAAYDSFTQSIDEGLAKPSSAAITLKVAKDGDAIKVTATAQADAEQVAKDSARIGGSKLKLRLVVTEEQIRYIGGNKLRYHHHVVRAMLGGSAGVALKDGKVEFETVVKMSEIRKGLEKYLNDYAKETSAGFEGGIPLDLAKLSVIAFVQDDRDKAVLNAVIEPLTDSK